MQVPVAHGVQFPFGQAADVEEDAEVEADAAASLPLGVASHVPNAPTMLSRTPAERPPVVLTSVFGLTSVVCVGVIVGLFCSLPSFFIVWVKISLALPSPPSALTVSLLTEALDAMMTMQRLKSLFCVCERDGCPSG